MKTPTPHSIYSVSELNQNIKSILERKFPMVWIYGELSNLKVPSSGHLYCTLKDQKSQIAVVIFRGQLRQLKFKFEDGMKIVGLGRLSVYEPRGAYQLVLEYAEPKGVGALQLAFEQLKSRLELEGLFDASNKKTLPFLPRKISIITSITGSVLHDILNIIDRRFYSIPIDIWPVRVQGDGAAEEIARAFAKANELGRSDIIILARGGGSLEDLAAFNSEIVARAIYSSVIPVISAVGHETDYTIADFVADVRAPTPSAAAEIAVPVRGELRLRCMELQNRCIGRIQGIISEKLNNFKVLNCKLVHPAKTLQERALRLDDYLERLNRTAHLMIYFKKGFLMNLSKVLLLNKPREKIYKNTLLINKFDERILIQIKKCVSENRVKLSSALASLEAMSPLAVLKRGYSIVRALPQKKIVTREKEVHHGNSLEITLSEGRLKAIVDKSTSL